MFIRAHGTTSGIVHSIDIHPSRKHTCILAILGGSLLGTFLSEGNLVLFQEENLNLILLFILLTSAEPLFSTMEDDKKAMENMFNITQIYYKTSKKCTKLPKLAQEFFNALNNDNDGKV